MSESQEKLKAADNPLLDARLWWPYIVAHKQQIFKQLRIILPYILVYAVVLFLLNYFNVSSESVHEFFGVLGPVIIPAFICVQIISSMTPLPDLPFTAAGVLFFPPLVSFILIIFGMWLGSFINFFIARKLGRTYISSKYPQTQEWLDKFTGHYGFETIIVARSFTFVTFDLVAYAAGVSSIKLRTFAIASFISLIPVAINSTLLGLALTSGSIWKTVALVVITGAMALLLGMGARKYRILQEIRATANAKSE